MFDRDLVGFSESSQTSRAAWFGRYRTNNVSIESDYFLFFITSKVYTQSISKGQNDIL